MRRPQNALRLLVHLSANEAGDRISLSEILFGRDKINSGVFAISCLQAFCVSQVHPWLGLIGSVQE